MNIAKWNAQLDAASTQWALILTTRAYLANLSDGDMGSLRAECHIQPLNDGGDVTRIARELHSSPASRSAGAEDLGATAGFFGRASRRLAALASSARVTDAVARDQALDIRFADSIGPPAPARY